MDSTEIWVILDENLHKFQAWSHIGVTQWAYWVDVNLFLFNPYPTRVLSEVWPVKFHTPHLAVQRMGRLLHPISYNMFWSFPHSSNQSEKISWAPWPYVINLECTMSNHKHFFKAKCKFTERKAFVVYTQKSGDQCLQKCHEVGEWKATKLGYKFWFTSPNQTHRGSLG